MSNLTMVVKTSDGQYKFVSVPLEIEQEIQKKTSDIVREWMASAEIEGEFISLRDKS